MAETVAATLEQEINGVENMLYIQSSSTQGQAQITVTFEPGTDLDAAQVLVQNRVALAEPRLPEQVRQIGVQVNKQETGFLMIVALTSTDPRSEEHTSELQSLMRISYAVFCLTKTNKK